MCGIQDKNDRDLLMHLHEWHKMVLNWYKSNMEGKKTSFLPEGYTWKSTPKLNKSLWEQYQKTSLSEAEKLFAKSHKEIMSLIKKHSNEELFTKSYYDWTGTTSLGAYFVSATSSHYDWATKLLKQF